MSWPRAAPTELAAWRRLARRQDARCSSACAPARVPTAAPTPLTAEMRRRRRMRIRSSRMCAGAAQCAHDSALAARAAARSSSPTRNARSSERRAAIAGWQLLALGDEVHELKLPVAQPAPLARALGEPRTISAAAIAAGADCPPARGRPRRRRLGRHRAGCAATAAVCHRASSSAGAPPQRRDAGAQVVGRRRGRLPATPQCRSAPSPRRSPWPDSPPLGRSGSAAVHLRGPRFSEHREQLGLD